MSDEAYKHEGYNVVPLKDSKTRRIVGWHVTFLSKSFLTKDEADRAIDARIEQLIAELHGRM
jgi:transposase InsO family protein